MIHGTQGKQEGQGSGLRGEGQARRGRGDQLVVAWLLGASWASSQFVVPAWSGADGGNGKSCCVPSPSGAWGAA